MRDVARQPAQTPDTGDWNRADSQGSAVRLITHETWKQKRLERCLQPQRRYVFHHCAHFPIAEFWICVCSESVGPIVVLGRRDRSSEHSPEFDCAQHSYFIGSASTLMRLAACLEPVLVRRFGFVLRAASRRVTRVVQSLSHRDHRR